MLWRLDRTGGVDQIGNQSLAGVLARLYDSATTPVLLWLSFALLLIAVGMIRARSAHADGDEIAAFTLIGLTGAIVGPVTGTHELIVGAARGADPGGRGGAASGSRIGGRCRVAARSVPARHSPPRPWLTYLLFVIAPVWTFADRWARRDPRRNAYALALILLVNALPWRPGVAPAFPINRWMTAAPPGHPAGATAYGQLTHSSVPSVKT